MTLKKDASKKIKKKKNTNNFGTLAYFQNTPDIQKDPSASRTLIRIWMWNKMRKDGSWNDAEAKR